MKVSQSEIAKYLDHTNVRPDATSKDIKKLCAEAKKYRFHSVCVTPYRVKEAKEYLGKGSGVEIIAVVGFPFGFTVTKQKVREAIFAKKRGASEIDMVVNIGAVKDGKWSEIKEEIYLLSKLVKPVGVKVIMEVGFLTRDELVKACQIAKEAGAAFVKTSTGYGPRTPTVGDIRLMRQTVGGDMGVKASGGIHSFEEAVAMLEVGANRIGTSSALQIIGVEAKREKDRAGSSE